jgi:hypothetical protein
LAQHDSNFDHTPIGQILWCQTHSQP